MNKFFQDLMSDNKQLLEKRGLKIAAQAEKESQKVIDIYIDQKDAAEMKLDKLNDLGPSDTTSLKYADDFDAKEWAQENAELELQIMKLEMTIGRLQKVHNARFSELPESGDAIRTEAKTA